jgi:hypothetical protein
MVRDSTAADTVWRECPPEIDCRIDAARSKLRETQAKLDSVRDAAANRVVKAYDAVLTSLAQAQAAVVVGQESAVAQAEDQIEDARAAAHTAAAGLAFAIGSVESAPELYDSVP